MLIRRINPETLAAQTGLPVEVIQELIDLGLIGTLPEPTETDLRELRRVRRLIDTLGLSHEAVDVILQMRRRLVALQNEVAQLRWNCRNAIVSSAHPSGSKQSGSRRGNDTCVSTYYFSLRYAHDPSL